MEFRILIRISYCYHSTKFAYSKVILVRIRNIIISIIISIYILFLECDISFNCQILLFSIIPIKKNGKDSKKK